MRVVVNQVTALGQKAGIGHYTAALLRNLKKQAGANVEAFPAGWVRQASALYSRARPSIDARQPAGEAAPSLWRRVRGMILQGAHQAAFRAINLHFRAQCQLRRYDLYHEPNTIPLACNVPTIATIHDLSLLLHPDCHTPERVAHFEKHLDRALEQCVHFLTDTDFIRDEAIAVLGLPPERITRVYLGIRGDLQVLPEETTRSALRRLDLPERYLLYVGTLEPRKNLLMLLQVYCGLPRDVRERWPLVLVGKWGWNTREISEFMAATARHEGVRHLGYVPDSDLAALYNGAHVLLYPSRYEGFGLPPLEMQACGGAVIASTAGSVAEIVGPQAHLIDPDDRDAWRAAFLRIVADEDWRRQLRAGAVEHAGAFTWASCARQTLAVYGKVFDATRSRLRRAG